MRADGEVDRKIEINTQNFEALDFNAAASKSGMRPGDAFGSTIRGAAPGLRLGRSKCHEGSGLEGVLIFMTMLFKSLHLQSEAGTCLVFEVGRAQ